VLAGAAAARAAWMPSSLSAPRYATAASSLGSKIFIAGGYRLERVTPVDQFKYSAHVELVGVFRRKDGRAQSHRFQRKNT